MGTYYRVNLASLPAAMSEIELQEIIDGRLENVDSLMSSYKSESEVSRFNRYLDTDWFPVSADTAVVVAEALKIYELSEGAFDITVSPLVDLWGFGPSKRKGIIPSPAAIEDALRNTGSEHLSARLSPPGLKKKNGDLQIDLSGIAKGFAVDSVAKSLESLGIVDYLVDVGGEMIAGGLKLDSSPWKIAIESPTAEESGIQRVLALSDQAIATSGDYRNYFEVDGQRYSHEIDPRSGLPIRHRLVSVSVLNASCMRADAWATALIVLGSQRGMQVAEGASLSTFLIVKGDEGFLEMESSRFKLSSVLSD